MPYTSCAADVAANIAKNCAKPIVGGYTGRALLFPVDQNPTIVVNAENPRILTSISPSASHKCIAVDNVFAEPFSGSQTASGADSGYMQFTKTFSFRVPLRGAGNSKDIIEPLANNALGFIAVIEKKDKVGDGSYEVVGYLDGLKANADGITRDEAANGGNVVVTMSCVENWFEVSMFDTDYATTKSAFDTLLTTQTL